uniref:DAZ-associated protein 2 n=3 Tax=Myotis myotis TaxID=51298 RepID=A0A7J7Z1F6_MYOMY|nr:DAZ associated protein 2 [Myotis myotis]
MNSKGQYPTQPTYPVQPPGNPVYPQTLHLPQAPPYTDAPPAYSELYRPSFVHPGAATVPTMSAAFPGASLYLPMAAQSVAVGPLGSTIPMAYYPVGPIYPPGSTVLVEGGYDAGARFGAGATAGNIPPPPPGCPPNAAQLAVMQGANVLVTQRKGNFFMGGSDGGYTIWCPKFQALFKLNKEPCNGSSTSRMHFEVGEVSIHKMNVGETALKIFL